MKKETVFSNTILILGAGSHVPYGLPSGWDLTKQIIELESTEAYFDAERNSSLLLPESVEKSKLLMFGLYHKFFGPFSINVGINQQQFTDAQNMLNDFVKKFRKSGVKSVDTYLSHQSTSMQDLRIGKFLIAYLLHANQDQNPLWSGDSRDWLGYLIDEHLENEESCELFFTKPPNIFTFNYDTLLERSLFSFLVYYRRITPDKALERIKNLNIQHVYGKMSFDIHGESDFSDPQSTASEINFIRAINTKSESSPIKALLCDGNSTIEHIYFLGFGFDEQNLNRLFHDIPGDILVRTKLYGSTKGLTKNKLKQTNNFFKQKFLESVGSEMQEKINFPENCNCLDIISEKFPIFS